MFKIRSRRRVSDKSIETVLCEAIKRKVRVQCVYESGDVRTLEPHCHGHSRAGDELLSAYQVAGPTDLGWKMFNAKKLIQVELTGEDFTPRPDFNRSHPGISEIHCQLMAV